MKTRTKIVLGFLFLGFVVLVRYAVRDIQLDLAPLIDGLSNLPALVTEDIRVEREVSGDLWKVRIPYLEREGELIAVRSVDISRRLHEGGEWYFFGAEGTYLYDQERASVSGVKGTLERAGRVWNLEGPEVVWTSASRDFFFPGGLTFYDGEYLVQAAQASMDTAGVVLLEKGGTIQWTRPLN